MSVRATTLTFSTAVKFPVPKGLGDISFSESIVGKRDTFEASLSLHAKKGRGIISAGATVPKPSYLAKAILNKIKKFTNFIRKQPAEAQVKDSCYIDMGIFEGLLNNAITWYSQKYPEYPNGFYDTEKLDAQLDTVFNPLVADGTNEIILSFAQICNISAILNPDINKSYSGTDKILEILTWGSNGIPNLDKPIVQNGQKLDMNIIQYITSYANSKGIKVDLSFGGAVATNTDYVIGDPIKAANDLVALMDKYNMETVDFDIENVPGLMDNGSAKVVTFFKTLHSALAAKNKKVILTVVGDAAQGPKGGLKAIFDEFDSCADGVRLMLYSDSQFYIDANNEDWGLETWLKIVQDPSKISIGFYDNIAYETPQDSDANYSPEKYQGFPTNPTRAEAAAWIYKKVLSQLGLSIDQLGKPFLWTDNPLTISQNQFFQDFDKALNQ